MISYTRTLKHISKVMLSCKDIDQVDLTYFWASHVIRHIGNVYDSHKSAALVDLCTLKYRMIEFLRGKK